MRDLERNKRLIYYALYDKEEIIYDDDGNDTGAAKVVYSTPLPYRINVSAAKGESSTRQFGDTENYDKVLITHDRDSPIVETSILWIDRLDTTKPHDYIVKKVARGLNSISFAITKVKVNAQN